MTLSSTTVSQRWRVQVKVTDTRHSKGSYSVKAGRRSYAKEGEEAVFSPYLALEIDFLALHFAPDDMWFIIPIEVLKGRTSLCFSFRFPERGPCAPFLERWDLLLG